MSSPRTSCRSATAPKALSTFTPTTRPPALPTTFTAALPCCGSRDAVRLDLEPARLFEHRLELRRDCLDDRRVLEQRLPGAGARSEGQLVRVVPERDHHGGEREPEERAQLVRKAVGVVEREQHLR